MSIICGACSSKNRLPSRTTGGLQAANGGFRCSRGGPFRTANHITEILQKCRLARRNDHNPDVTDRFELFIAAVNTPTVELNDPVDQAGRFKAQADLKSTGDNEAMHFDQDCSSLR